MSWHGERGLDALDVRSYILVTGGAGGIGSAVCRLLPTIGITPIVGYNSNESVANTISEELNGFAIRIDMAEIQSIEKAIQIITQKIQPPHSLVGVVLGASPPPEIKPFGHVTYEDLSCQLMVNVIGTQHLLKGLIKKFFQKTKSGVVVGILSKAIGSEGRGPVKGMGAYVVAKAALKGMLSVCAAEYSWLKVRTVSPGFTRTAMLAVFDSRYLEIIENTETISSAEEVAQLILEEIVS